MYAMGSWIERGREPLTVKPSQVVQHTLQHRGIALIVRWQRYRFLGADLAIRKCYQNFQVFECVCYFSAFFCAGFGIQFVWLGESLSPCLHP